jgi:hypothetical protein
MREIMTNEDIHVCCQTELLLNGQFIDPSELNNFCRSQNVGYISSQNFGPWGFAFTDFGQEHIVTDEDGEQTRSFIVTMIEKGEKTVVQTHEGKRHIF